MTSTRRGAVAGWLAVVLVVLVVLMGGGSRPDVASIVLLRPLAAMAGGVALLLPARRKGGAALIILASLAIWMTVQLVPLPPALWTGLPGRELIATIDRAVGDPLGWRAISLGLDGTLNSLFSLVVPAAVLLSWQRLDDRWADRLPLVLLALIGLSAAVGVAQILGPSGGPLYLYRITAPGSAVGLFANPNHQAAALACALPLLGYFSAREHGFGTPAFRIAVAAASAVLIIPLLIVTGSRAGLGVGAVGLIGGLWVARSSLIGATAMPSRHVARPRSRPIGLLLAGVVGVGALAVLLWSQRDSIDRIFAASSPDELRVRLIGRLTARAIDYLPVGSGFGTFEKVWRIDEPLALLSRAYLNHAHNDLAELAVEGGLPAVALLIAALALVALGLFRAGWSGRPTPAVLRARAGGVMLAVLGLASLVDYPLRTPTGMMLAALAFAWVTARGDDGSSHALSGNGAASKPPVTNPSPQD